MIRNLVSRRIALAALVGASVGTAQAQAWPAKPVRIVTAFGAGSASDIVARMLAEELQLAFKQPFVVENKPGASGMLAAEMLAKLDVAAVPYKSTPQGLTDLVGGQVSFMFVDLASSRPHYKSGRIRLLAMSSEQRSTQVPEVPPLAQAANLPGFDLSAWVGVLGPAGMPPGITAKISDQLQQVLARKDIIERLQTLGADVAPAGPAALDAYMKEQLLAWGRKVRDAGITPE